MVGVCPCDAAVASADDKKRPWPTFPFGKNCALLYLHMPTLNWIGKDKVVSHHLDVPYRVLNHKYGFKDGKQSEEETGGGNMIIQGDNLEALKALLPKYEGRVKCIYIDPPYNTGNEGWVYNDNVNDPKIKKWLGEVVGTEEIDLTRHDKWLCMMYPRLRLLHKLLKDDGVIFVSIDNNEFHHLRMIMDEIFGEKSFVTVLHVQMSTVQGQKVRAAKQGNVVKNGEHILVYAKSGSANIGLRPLYDPSAYDGHYSILLEPQDDGTYNESNLTDVICAQDELFHVLRNAGLAKETNKRSFSMKSMPHAYMAIPALKEFIHRHADRIVRVHTMTELDEGEIPKGMKQGITYTLKLDKREYLVGIDTNGMIKQRFRLSDKLRKADDYYETYGVTNIRGDWWGGFYLDMGNINKEGDVQFLNGKKPVRLIAQLIAFVTHKNDIILDSFAGSGTTGHAVLNLNKQDGGSRKFVLVELGDYADSITTKRNKRVITGNGDTKGTGGSFDFYELGAPLFKDAENLNEEVGEEKIREYVWYTEAQQPLKENQEGNKYFLGAHNATDYYFFYEKDQITNLDYAFLATLGRKADATIIYADQCSLSESYLRKHGITFKKIPRDISKI